MKDNYTKEEIRGQAHTILKNAKFLHLALAVDNEPYLVTVNYGYDNNYLYFHSSQKGKKIDMIEKNPNICYEIYYGGDIYSNEHACNWGTKYRSLIGRGEVELLKTDAEKLVGLKAIMLKYSNTSDHDFNENVMHHTNIYRIKIDEISTKQNKMYW